MTTAGSCGSTTAAPLRCRRRRAGARAIRRRQRRPSSRIWRTALDMFSDPWSIGDAREPGRHRQRAARGQRPHDGRRGAAARRLAPARQAHSRAVAPWLDAGIPGFGVHCPRSSPTLPVRSRRRAARRAASCGAFRALTRSGRRRRRRLARSAGARARTAGGAMARARSRAARAVPAPRRARRGT